MKGKLSTLDEWLLNQVVEGHCPHSHRIVDGMLHGLRKKLELQKQQQIDDLTEQLRIARV